MVFMPKPSAGSAIRRRADGCCAGYSVASTRSVSCPSPEPPGSSACTPNLAQRLSAVVAEVATGVVAEHVVERCIGTYLVLEIEGRPLGPNEAMVHDGQTVA